MANEVPESVSIPLPAPPPEPRERPSLVAGREAPPESRATIGAPRNPLVPPEGSVEAHLDDAAREALSSAALEGALGLMTYGKAATRLGRTAAMQRSLARNPNYPRRELLRRTGYQRGLFGMGVETHGDASLKPSVLFRQGRVDGMLGELAYVHREVEAAYPGIRNMSVRIVPDAEWDAHVASLRGRLSEWSVGNTASGVHVRNGGGISIRGRKPGEPLDVYFSRMDSTLVHELQHVAQDLDGLRAPYPHPTREAYLADAREVEARNSATRRLFSGDERESMLRTATQDTPPEAVNLDDKGGDNYGTFRNFLASDDVPESIFGFPVVQREEDYTESDLEFFKENPKAAGFYDLGDDADDGTQEAWNAGESPEFDAAVAKLRAAEESDAPAAFDAVVETLKSVDPHAYRELRRIDSDGRYARAEERALLSAVLRADPRYTEESFGRFFYGGRWGDVRSKALSLRGAGSQGQLYQHGVRFTPYSRPVRKPHELRNARDPVKSVFTSGAEVPAPDAANYNSWVAAGNAGRAGHWPATGGSYVPPNNVLGLVHEVMGHGWNPADDGPGNPADPQKDPKWRGMYYVANDAEFAAEFGNLRKQLFRRSYAQYGQEQQRRRTPFDIADPGNFVAFAGSYKNNPRSYAFLTDASKKFVEGYNALMAYTGSDPDIQRRKAQVSQIVQQPEIRNQIVGVKQEETLQHEKA